MALDLATLDKMQGDYKTAVDVWVSAIRKEEALASINHSEAQIDQWEAADSDEEDARNKAKQAKTAYEGALREEFFNF